MKGSLSFAVAMIGFASTIFLASCGGNSPGLGQSQILGVSVTAGANSVEAAGTDSLTAAVTGDSNGKGVTWTVSCSAPQCGKVVPSSILNATYNAPSTPPTSDLTVTVKAVSIADSSKSGSTTITVPAITVSVNISGTGITASTATTATVQVGAGNAVQLNATVSNDPSSQGVKFAASPASQALSIQDALDASYNAPSVPPASELTVTVTVTSIEDSTKTQTVTITVPSVTISINPPSVDNVEAASDVRNIIATEDNDSTKQGVNWTVSCSAAPCGSVSPTKTLSGAAMTYSAPATPPSPGDNLVTLTATSVADPSAQASMTINVKAISIAVTAPNTDVLFNTSQSNIAAVVSFDPRKQGVSWSVQCSSAQCGSVSPNSSLSGGVVTYSAPTTPPASDLFVTLVASSQSNPVQQNSIQIRVPAISVTVLPPSALIPVGAIANLNATPFTPTIGNDSSTEVNVNWTLTQNGVSCSPDCGTITLTTTTTGTATVYAAPAAVPVSATVTITVTSATDTSKSANATITLTTGTVKMVPGSLTFRLNKHQSQGTESVALTNTGSSTLSISSQTTTGSNAFSVASPCQGSSTTDVVSGASCNISVSFKPPVASSFNGTLLVTDNDVSSPQQLPLQGSKCARCTAEGAFRSALASNQTSAVPAPTGVDKVGTRVIDLVDATRSDPYLADGSKRELLVRLWYPAAHIQRCEPAAYTASAVWNYLAKLEKVAAPSVKTNSCQDAPVAAGAHPVVVFTHGYTGTFTDYTFLFEDLASRGYIVASVNHTFEATAAQFSDGRLAKSMLGSHLGNTLRMDNQTVSFAVAVRIGDLKFVIDQLERLNMTPTSSLAGKLDMSRIAVAGHSLGGLTALLGLKADPRFRAAITLDGVSPGPEFGAFDKPVLMLLAGHDSWDQDTCRLWNSLGGPRLAVNLRNADHLTPSDAVWLARGAITTGALGIENTVQAMREYIAAFLDSNLNGNPPDKLLEGASADYPDVELSTPTASPCSTAKTSSPN